MGRRDFRAHIEHAAATPEAYGVLAVCSKDSEIQVQVQSQHGPVTVTAVINEISDYPDSHSFLSLYVEDSAPDNVSLAVAALAEKQTGHKTIFSLLQEISQRLSSDADVDTDMPDSQIEDFDDDEGAYEPSEVSDDVFFGSEDGCRPVDDTPATATYDNIVPLETRNAIRRDLDLLKNAGYRVGVYDPLVQGHPAYLISTCRIAKLGISEEAMEAWQLRPTEYLVLLTHYPNGYKSIDHVKDLTSVRGVLDFRFAVSSSHKPSRDEVIEAFATTTPKAQHGSNKAADTGLRKLFIAGALMDLFGQKFLQMLKCRVTRGMSWDGAMAFWHDHHATDRKGELAQDPKYGKEDQSKTKYPEIVTADHISSYRLGHEPGARLSLPLATMQFYVRQVVRCTEFCLVCHRKMPTDLEAIKPYVCDSQLCLYQYMQLGFGPSIEHEIVSQPQVVDLLISLCWETAKTCRLKKKKLPRGLGLRVPPIDILRLAAKNNASASSYPVYRQTPASLADTPLHEDESKTQWLLPKESAKSTAVDLKSSQLLFEPHVTRNDLNFKPGDWIQLKALRVNETLHCKVELIMLPTVQLSKPIVLTTDGSEYLAEDLSTPGFQQANFVTYDGDLDSFNEANTQEAIGVLLDLLPTVKKMKEYLQAEGAKADLKKWPRLPAPSLGLLRWIIASNRACIMQAGSPDEEDDPYDGVWGMSGWTQFRIAMGAPDKERRFINSVRTEGTPLNPDIPTIFAWHGSALSNWHSIVREGLNFEETINGRAYGHGVYLSKDLATSLTYSRSMAHSGSGVSAWRSSELKIRDAVSLNEVVNSPGKFVSSSPHFVVNQIDWIQTRYLFVQTSDYKAPTTSFAQPMTPEERPLPQNPILQDPVHFPVNNVRKRIEIPESATKSRAKAKISVLQSRAVIKGHKKLKTEGGFYSQVDLADGEDDEDDTESVATDQDDRELLQEELERNDSVISPKYGVPSDRSSQTDFVPGQLDYSTLDILPPPEGRAASISASKRLQADFKAMIKTQSSQPLHELGWYIDPDHMENLYQWIVELHSFEPHLPLAKDMKANHVNSIVLELTFGKNYPFTPPFVRVIRPRFLPFLQGGGGHVTAGGALCMELLTNDGWAAVNSIESVLMQVRLAMSSQDPKPARLDTRFHNSDYTVSEAIEAYIRACQSHGWTVPDDFRQTVMAGRRGGSLSVAES